MQEDMLDAKKEEKAKKAEKKDPMLAELELRVEALEGMISKFAALAGQRNLPLEYKLKPWDPEPKDMKKFN